MESRRFTMADQQAFAALSGDLNPLHLDPMVARRLIFGRVVVHGVHLLLWALDRFSERLPEGIRLTALTAEFRLPAGLGEEIAWCVIAENEGRAEIEILGQAGRCVWARFAWERRIGMERSHIPAPGSRREECRQLTFESASTAKGSVDLFLDPQASGHLFPRLTERLPERQMAQILATTRLVGMVCPGLHSVYSGLDLAFPRGEGGSATMAYEAVAHDSRFSSLQMKVTGRDVDGTIKTFFRPPPREQASFERLRRLVVAREFEGQKALVVGGSRGLGEVTAKLLAAAGADVTLTFARGATDAERVVDEVSRAGGLARSLAFDVLHPPDLGLSLGRNAPDHLYYYAAPPISGAARGSFSAAMFHDFCDFFVLGFVRTVQSLQQLAARPIRALYPSSIFVEDVPLNMGEYAAAKMAGEIACAFLEKSHPGIRVQRPRFPRMATDQTASLLPVKAEDPAPVVLGSLRRLRDAS